MNLGFGEMNLTGKPSENDRDALRGAWSFSTLFKPEVSFQIPSEQQGKVPACFFLL